MSAGLPRPRWSWNRMSNARAFCLAVVENPWYNKKAPGSYCQVLGVTTMTDGYASSGMDQKYHPSFGGGDLLPPSYGEEVRLMVTSELYQFCLVIIGIIGLVLQAKKK